MTLRQFHDDFAWFVVVANAVVGLWALGAHWLAPLRLPRRTRWLWWATAVAEISIFVQVAAGVALVQAEDADPPQFHMFYGFVALITVGIIYSYRQQLAQWKYLLYGLGGLFLMGLGLRAMVVGPR